ncbi:MAG: RecT family recombinase [Pseudomonadota bacterium]
MNLPATISPNEGELEIPARLEKILMNSVFKNLEGDEPLLAYRLAKRRGLDVEAKQIYFVPYVDQKGNRSVIPQTSIDGLRLIAARTKCYGGQINPKLTVRLKDGAKQVIDHEEYDPGEIKELISATIEVINKDFPQPQKATALLKSYSRTYNNKLQGLWESKTDVMLLKCAESLALRKAFPQDLGGLYSNEEMDQAKNDIEAVNVSFSTIETTQQPTPEPVILPDGNSEPIERETPEAPVIDVLTEDVQVNAQTKTEVITEIESDQFINETWGKFTGYCAEKIGDSASAIELAKKAVRERFKVEDPAKISSDRSADLSLYLRTVCMPILEQNGLV